MAVAKSNGAKGKCDKLFSRLIRRNGECENCTYECPGLCVPSKGLHKTGCKLQCAHLISRHLSATRCEPRNAFALCAKCHYHFGLWPLEFATFVLDRRAPSEYASLKELAQYKGKPMNWDEKLNELEQLWGELQQEWD